MHPQNQPTMPAKANGVLDGLSRQHVGEPSVTRTLAEEGRGRGGEGGKGGLGREILVSQIELLCKVHTTRRDLDVHTVCRHIPLHTDAYTVCTQIYTYTYTCTEYT